METSATAPLATTKLPPEVKVIFQRGAAAAALYAIAMNAIGVTAALLGNGPMRLQFGALILAGMLALGGLRVAEFVRWCSNLLVGATFLTPALLLIVPPALLLTYLKLEPLSGLLVTADWIAVTALAFWLTRLLKSQPVAAARTERGYPMRKERWARLIGAACTLALIVVFSLLLRGEAAQKGVAMAAQEFGTEYHYMPRQILRMHYFSTGESQTCTAVVIWNDRGIGEKRYCWQSE